MLNEHEVFEMHAAAKHINDYTSQLMSLLENGEVNSKMGRYDLITKWRKIDDELGSITIGFGKYPYNDMLIKD